MAGALVLVGFVGGIGLAVVNVSGIDPSVPVMSATYASLSTAAECDLVAGAVIERHAPGATCDLQAYAGMTRGGVQTHAPSWTVLTPGKPQTSIALALTITDEAPHLFTDSRDRTTSSFASAHTSPATVTVEVGDEAYMLSGRSALSPNAFDARILARSGNAHLDIGYRGYASVAESEAAVKAIAINVLSRLRRA
ncbi:hypothetical protein ACWIGI_34770 [Nocardia sp. NPDC055321]